MGLLRSKPRRGAQLAKAAAVSAETVRHYTDLGLLRPTRDCRDGALA
ncbi:MerR family transcriptional regulator [Pseudomonas sp. sp1636]